MMESLFGMQGNSCIIVIILHQVVLLLGWHRIKNRRHFTLSQIRKIHEILKRSQFLILIEKHLDFRIIELTLRIDHLHKPQTYMY